MKQALQRKIYAGLSARVILIMIIAAVTAGSFTLGYIVGKKTQDESIVTALQQPAVDPNLQKNEDTLPESIPTQDQVTPQAAVTQSLTAQTNGNEPSTATAQPQTKQDPKISSANAITPKASSGPSAAQNSGKEKLPEPVTDTRSDLNTGTASTAPEITGDIIYFVQAGAFSNRNKADALKRKLDTKGYKTTIRKETSKKRKILYKVLAGEFKRKDEAEIVALKLKKTEGLKASVNKG